MYMFGFDDRLITLICQLYTQANSVVMFQSAVGILFYPTVGICQDCLLSLTLFNILLQQIMGEVLDSDSSTVSVGKIETSKF